MDVTAFIVVIVCVVVILSKPTHDANKIVYALFLVFVGVTSIIDFLVLECTFAEHVEETTMVATAIFVVIGSFHLHKVPLNSFIFVPICTKMFFYVGLAL